MNKYELLAQDLAAINGREGVPWIESQSPVNLGRGTGVLPLVGIPDETIAELRAETARVAALLPPEADRHDRWVKRSWIYLIRRANGQIEHHVTIVDPEGSGMTIQALTVVPDGYLATMAKWILKP